MASAIVGAIGEINDQDVLDPQDLELLYSWIDAAPFSRPKKHIARDFSDGVSVAEIVHFYLPRMVELHNYVNANSTAQKHINWNMLNRKVFVKLNLKLSDKIVDNVIDAKPGAIEQVLWDLRAKVIEVNPKTISRSNTSSQLKGKSSSGYSEVKIGKRVPSGVISTHVSSRIPTKSLNSISRKSSSSPAPSYASKLSEKSPECSYSAGLKDDLSQYASNVIAKNKTEANSGEQTAPVSGGVDSNANSPQDLAALPPAHLIYKGHKMVPAMLLEIKLRQIRDMESVVNGLQKKLNFLDNLVALKESRVEDLTRQLHTLKTRFQEFTQAKIPDL